MLPRVRIDPEGRGGKKEIQRRRPSPGCYVGNLYKCCFFQASQSLTLVSEALMATRQKIFLGLFSLATYILESLHDLVTRRQLWMSGSEIFKPPLTGAQGTDPAH